MLKTIIDTIIDIMGYEGIILLGVLTVIGVIGTVCIWTFIIDFIIDFIRGGRK